MLLVFCLMLSHGSMGEAVPHAHDNQHAYASHTADHHYASDTDGEDDDNKRTGSPEVTGHHIHLIGDVSAAATLAFAHLTRHSLIVRIPSDAPPRSLRTPPLLEPPSA